MLILIKCTRFFMSQLDGSQCVSVPPSWLEKPSNREVTLGQKVELPCRADGAPLPKITWKKEIGKRNKTLPTREKSSKMNEFFAPLKISVLRHPLQNGFK